MRKHQFVEEILRESPEMLDVFLNVVSVRLVIDKAYINEWSTFKTLQECVIELAKHTESLEKRLTENALFSTQPPIFYN